VLYLRLIILSAGGDVPDSETLLVIDFINLKIKPTLSFKGAHMSKLCVHILIDVSDRTCISINIYTVFLKKKKNGVFKSVQAKWFPNAGMGPCKVWVGCGYSISSAHHRALKL
jgi:hypothetical protein